MRKWLLLGPIAALALAGGPALADVTVTATIDKEKDKTVTETITKDKDVILRTRVFSEPEKFAESESIVNQSNSSSVACENCAEKEDIIIGAGSGGSGVLSINQASGNMNNQGNAVSAAVDVGGTDDETPEPEGTGFAESQAAADQRNFDNNVETVNILFRRSVIQGSINGNSGIVGVNQSAGNLNNQANVVSLAVSLSDTGVALSEADLGQFNTDNQVLESRSEGSDVGVDKSATIVGSINGNQGIVGVNQSSGNMANQANVVSVAAVQGS